MKFVDDTLTFAGNATKYADLFGVIDFNHNGINSLFVRTSTNTFRTLASTNGVFAAFGMEFPALTNANYTKCLVADLNNDRFDDVLMIGDQGSHAYRFATNGLARDMSRFSRLSSLKAVDALIADIDFTGKLDLLAIQPEDAGLKVFRNLGSLYFKDISKTSSIQLKSPTPSAGGGRLEHNDGCISTSSSRKSESPMYLQKQRGAIRSPTNTLPAPKTAVQAVATGDLNNGTCALDLVTLANGRSRFSSADWRKRRR